MHFEGTFEVSGAPKEKVYEFIMGPNRISQCMPDLRNIEIHSPDDFTVIVRTGVSFIKGNFAMHFTVQERQPPNHAKLVAHGTGIGSTVDLDTAMDLSDLQAGIGTSMKWKADAKVGGRIASVGSRLINGQAEKIMRELFECLRGKLETATPTISR